MKVIFTDKEFETVKRIRSQNGYCKGISCRDCPFVNLSRLLDEGCNLITDKIADITESELKREMNI